MRFFSILMLGLLLMAGCASQSSFGEPITEGEPTPVPTAVIPTKPTYQVQRGDVVDRRQYFGRMSPVISRNLQFSIDGRVLVVNVDTGDTVEAGDIIAELDTSVLEVQLVQAQTDLEVARTLLSNIENEVTINRQRAELNLNLAQLTLDYAITQAGENPTSRQSYDIQTKTIQRDLAQLEIDALETVVDPQLVVEVSRAEQRVREVEDDIEASTLYAPMDGLVTSFRLDRGTIVTEFEPVGAVADTSELEIRDTLQQEEMAEMTEGMLVEIGIANRPDESVPGTLVTLPQPFGTGSDEFMHVQLDNLEDSENFRMGDRVTLSIVVNESPDTLWLPPNALREFNGRRFVVIQNESGQQRVDVKLGILSEDRVEIIEGVEENQVVVGP